MLGRATFHLRPEAFDESRRQRLRALAARLAVLVAILVGVVLFTMRDEPDALGFALAPLAIIAVTLVVVVRRQLARWRTEWSTYEVVVTDDDLSRSVHGYPTLRIPRSEVSAIDEAPTGLNVRRGALTAIWLPRAIEGFDVLRERLSTWRTPQTAVPASKAVIWALSALGGGWVLAMLALEREIGRKGVAGAVPEIVALELLALGLLVYALRLRTLENRARGILVKIAVMAMIVPLLVVALQGTATSFVRPPDEREGATSGPR